MSYVFVKNDLKMVYPNVDWEERCFGKHCNRLSGMLPCGVYLEVQSYPTFTSISLGLDGSFYYTIARFKSFSKSLLIEETEKSIETRNRRPSGTVAEILRKLKDEE